jgi:hypothetical protein
VVGIKPLLKKSNFDPENFQNYHPISDLPFLSICFKKAVEDKVVYETPQSGFKTPP